MAKTTRSRSRRSKRKPSGKPRRSHSRSKRRTQTRRDGRDQYEDGGWGNPDLRNTRDSEDYLWPDYLFAAIWQARDWRGESSQEAISIDLTGGKDSGYITGNPGNSDQERKNRFTHRFEELASGRRKVTDFDNVRNLREWVNEEMLDLWKAHMNVRDWNWWGQRYES